jgi:AcrR family transcriptional regulator
LTAPLRSAPLARRPRSRSGRPRPPAQRAVRAHATRDRILDSAEKLFAARGYHGVSMREITLDAGVPLALSTYHFATKGQLYGQVIERRGVSHAAQMLKYLDDALAESANGRPDAERIVRAFCASIFERLVNGGPGWRRYIRLTAWSAEASQNEKFLRPLNDLFDPVLERYVQALRASYPEMLAVDFYSGFYFVQAALVYTVGATGGIDRVSHGALRSRDFERILPRLVAFLTSGFDRLASGRY